MINFGVILKISVVEGNFGDISLNKKTLQSGLF